MLVCPAPPLTWAPFPRAGSPLGTAAHLITQDRNPHFISYSHRSISTLPPTHQAGCLILSVSPLTCLSNTSLYLYSFHQCDLKKKYFQKQLKWELHKDRNFCLLFLAVPSVSTTVRGPKILLYFLARWFSGDKLSLIFFLVCRDLGYMVIRTWKILILSQHKQVVWGLAK